MSDSEERHAFVLDCIQAGVVIHNASTEIVYANAKASEMLGVTHDRILGVVNTDPRWVFTTEDGAPMPVEDYPVSRALRTRQVVRDLVVGVRRPTDDQNVWLMGNAYPVMDGDGVPIEVVVTFSDVTGLKTAERARQKSEERLELVLQGSTDAPWDIDLITGEAYYSPRWWSMVGYEPNELPLNILTWTHLLHPDDKRWVLRDLGRSLDEGHTSWSIEFRFQHKDGHVVQILSRGFILRDATGQPIRVSGANTDITERRAIEAQLRQSQKLEAIGQLAGGVAHDFNNLLAVICGNIELVQQDFVGPAEQQEMLDEALGAARRGAELTRRLLASTRQQALQPSVVHVETVVTNLVHVLRRLIHESIRIDTHVAADVSRIRIDASQFENALLNLAINARDAMPTGGVLAISAENVDLTDTIIPADVDVAPGSYVRVSISDDGVGMSRDTLQHALEPFFTTKPVGQGSGLGLSMVYGFVKQSGGGLKIYSEPGRGTSIQLYLPATDEHVSAGDQAHDDAPRASDGHEEVVLVVEDDSNVRLFCLRCLNSLGYRTIEATNGPSALRVLASGEHIDLMLTDVVMPNGLNGPEVASAARKSIPGLKVLFMSGYPAHMLDVDDALAREHLLTKPFSRAMLARTIRAVLDAPIQP